MCFLRQIYEIFIDLFVFDNNYFNDFYQGIPIGGYTNMFEKMLDGIKIQLGTDYFSNREYFNSKIIYSKKK